jgi:hypothetical protein
VTELEQRLVALGREIDFPSEPDLASGALARLERRPRSPFPWRVAAVALALLAVAVGAAFAVPQARTTILRWFHLRGVTVVRVETLPPTREPLQAGLLGPPLPRVEAERAVGFRLLLPPFAGAAPKRVRVLNDALATVSLRAHGQPVLLSEYRGVAAFLRKAVVGETRVEPLRVDGDPGLWVAGTHTFTYFDRQGMFRERTVLVRRNVLLWVHDGITLRLEGKLSKAEALGIARVTRSG